MQPPRSLFRTFVALVVGSAAPVVSFAAKNPPDAEPIVIGHRYHIHSNVLNEDRTYAVHLPRDYDFSNDRYPVLILLDGDGNLAHVSSSVDQLVNNGRAMPMLVVGIENTERQRDLTPPLNGPRSDSMAPGPAGGAQQFLSFIADELLPHLDRTYRTRPTRILVGHSYGGLFAVYTLLNRPGIFKAYIAVSPSLWWDDQALAKQTEQFVADHKDLRAAVYVTMGNEGGAMLGGAQKFVGALASAPNRNFQVTFQHWPEESHGSVVLRSVYDGLQWLHEFYYTPDPGRTYDESGLQYFDKRFASISDYLGYEVKVPERLLMNIQFYLGKAKRPREQQQVLNKVLQLYPTSPGAHYELGRSYLATVGLATDDKERAVEELKRALDLYPGHAGARAELEKLGIDPKSIVVEKEIPASVLRSYVGEYRYSGETTFVTFEDGKLFLRVDRDKRPLQVRADGVFFAIEVDREYTFNLKRDRAVSVTIQRPGFTYESRKVR